ncbi:Rab GTPase TBC domain [Trypanosoma vivax]|uniref:Rab-GAP TBC domain-containing protein n=1 Tax=Trypanosoma vivax (strain Y486) TaxID=1055687 RepID=G0TVN9_TRYVY|nr:hypothetical protein TRVL_03643 [Trypanosoma vivax]KAH8620570.1 Rab GTPase TBC domain [Trypanosoma vivax]CCC48005.1 conserved hypothetical protein [Trypanosoma vivax Y486]
MSQSSQVLRDGPNESIDELLFLHNSVVGSRIIDALLRRSMDFGRPRPPCALHSIRWRLLTGLLPSNVDAAHYAEVWAACTAECIDGWHALNAKIQSRLKDNSSYWRRVGKKGRFADGDSTDGESDEESVGLENPLLPAEGSSYALRYQQNALCTAIMMDVKRLHWDIPFFDSESSQKHLLDLLANYCLEHNCDYKQGLHEIAAFVMYNTHKDASLIKSLLSEGSNEHAALPTTFASICPMHGVVAVSFYIFSAIMHEAGLNLSRWYYLNDTGGDDTAVAARNVQCKFLEQLDPDLHNQMNNVYEIEPMSYLMRWLRLLFLREFSLAQCADLWDVFLSERCLAKQKSYCINESTVTAVAVFMLLRAKSQLMGGCNEALMCVMRYPSVSDICSLVKRAVHFIDSSGRSIGRYLACASQSEFEKAQLIMHSFPRRA